MRKRLLPMFLLMLICMTGMSMKAMAQDPANGPTDEPMKIATPEDLYAFAETVASGVMVDGLLTADINLTESDYPMLMIGTSSAPYTGTFDGQGHTVTYNYEDVENYGGLFSYLDDATIRNLRVEGSAIVQGIHFGALMGRVNGDVLVENVVTNVNITGDRSGVTGDAGMVGALYGNVTFNNCATLGIMGNPGSSMYCGFTAWAADAATSVLNNCFTTCSLTEDTGLDYCYTFCRGRAQITNCYYLNEIGTVDGGTQITTEQLANGSLCYKLNGDQTVINWTQTIGTDLIPQIGTGSQQVYASGELRCDGAEIPDKPLSYSNTESYPTKPDHKFGSDGICTVCGQADPDAVKQNEEGYYLISNAKQLNWLNQRISGGETDSKVLLTDDIDLTESDFPKLMIGTQGTQFCGIFDGQGHTVTYSYQVNENYCGLFRFVDGATIRNLYVKGDATVKTIHFGALVGWASNTVLIENVITDVDITGEHTGVTGDGGMFGRLEGDVTFNNCATLGKMGNPGSSMYCGFVAYAGSGSSTLNNCFTASSLKEGTGTDYCYTFCRGTYTTNNCYYLSVIGAAQGTPIAEEDLESGALCYKLNGDQSSIHWYQTLGQDDTPVPDDSHARVFGAGDVFMNITDDASFSSFVSFIIDEETETYGEMKAQRSLIEAYLEALAELSESPDIDTFLAGYDKLGDLRQSIKSCAEAYSAYITKVEETKLYLEEHPELSNPKIELLTTYLNEYEDPSEDFPNGSAPTIIEDCELSEEEIIAETALIDAKLIEAISYSPQVGTEITMLFTNADLSDKFNGWEGKPATGTGISETSPIVGAECFNNTMDMYQTLTGLENGIYELQVNGAYRPYPYNDYYNTNYAATLYANGIHNYFQTNIEDMISVDDAIDGKNCHITGSIADFAVPNEDGDIVGYTMQGVISCANAFQAGRYPNSVLCNVTDGTLTIGIRQPGSGQQPDWLGFGNIRVFYWGQMDEATVGLDRVLASQSARARTILENYEYSSGLDYATYPNFSQALKDDLRKTLEAAATTTEAEAKYQLIEKFSSLFLQIYDCKQAYITLMDKAEEVNDLMNAFSEVISDEEFLQMEDLYQTLTNAYMDGTMTAEEALAIDPKSMITLFPDVEDGYYMLRNLTDFYVFTSLVNEGSTKLNAKLLTDIDLRDTDFPNLMIGVSNAQFAGTFDGQGHSVTYSYDVNADYGGLFSYINGGTIRNLIVNGEATVPNIHFGGLMGRADGTVLVENVITNVDITGVRSGVTGDAGMLGANYGDVTFNNCATYGTMGNPGSSMYCGFVAWDNSAATSTLNNCYTTCSLIEDTGLDYCYTFCRTNGKVVLNNCYYLNQIGTAQGTQMTAEQFASGEVCYKLNGDQSDRHWFQKLGKDAYPTLEYDEFAIVFYQLGVYSNDYAPHVDTLSEAISKGETIYDLSGRKIVNDKMKKGIYIINGKKVLK